MVRFFTIAVLGLMTAPAFGQAESASPDGTPPLEASTIVAGDWTMAAQNDQLIVFVKAASVWTGADGYRRLSVRFEFATPQVANGSKAYLSMQVLTEFDCAHNRTRNLESTAYAAHNLVAPLGPTQQVSGEWLLVPAGSVASNLERQACPTSP